MAGRMRRNHWLTLFLVTDLAFIFLVWILRPDALMSISLFLILFTVFITAIGIFLEQRRRKKIAEALEHFLEMPERAGKEALIQAAGEAWSEEIERLFSRMTEQQDQINEKTIELASYREYIEAWVHEMKTPLSLSTLVLENHKEEMTPYVYGRMNYVQHQINENVERILYYARLQIKHADEKYAAVRLDLCVEEAMAEYRAFAEEKQIALCLDLTPLTVVSDKRVLIFLISQLLGNAIKYADAKDAKVSAAAWQEGDTVFLAIRDNGRGVPPEDAPFLFDKGFTGSHPDRQKATGMGLYLVKQYAKKLCVKVELEPISITGQGFGIRLIFQL
ncbi:sensor histidine kinase [Hominifimenecus sp. rT4P-3]|uniref:sensor histidine kinase n=1 Tax=Hominifimenecus sp. rT4P-3 TaxID=3242979 RepID=UPI003DA38C64